MSNARAVSVLRVSVLTLAALALVGGAAAQGLGGPTYDVTITNLTRGQVLSPPLIVVHASSISLFTPGEPASDALAAVAEDADYGDLIAMLEANHGTTVESWAMADGPLPPGESVTLQVNARGLFSVLSGVAMLVTTNDAFAAVSAVPLRGFGLSRGAPLNAQSAVYAIAWDAGSEGNSELCSEIPGPPCHNPFVRNTADAEGYVHVHAGLYGGGDLDPAEFGWLNPVAVVQISRR